MPIVLFSIVAFDSRKVAWPLASKHANPVQIELAAFDVHFRGACILAMTPAPPALSRMSALVISICSPAAGSKSIPLAANRRSRCSR